MSVAYARTITTTSLESREAYLIQRLLAVAGWDAATRRVAAWPRAAAPCMGRAAAGRGRVALLAWSMRAKQVKRTSARYSLPNFSDVAAPT